MGVDEEEKSVPGACVTTTYPIAGARFIHKPLAYDACLSSYATAYKSVRACGAPSEPEGTRYPT